MAISKTTSKQEIEPAVVRMWATRFPGIELCHFHALRTEGPNPWLRNSHNLSYAGPHDELFRYGLADATMLPNRPKRKKWSGEVDGWTPLSGNSWHSRWRAKGVLHVWREIDENFPRQHALSDFDTHHWPFGATKERLQEIRRESIESGFRIIHGFFDAALASGFMQELLPAIKNFEKEARAIADKIPEQRSRNGLRLVVDNTRS